MHKPPYCWSDKDQNKYRNHHGILGLAKATQQKYLGIQSWDSVWHKKLEDKHKKFIEQNKLKSKKQYI